MENVPLGTVIPTRSVYAIATGELVLVDDRTFDPAQHSEEWPPKTAKPAKGSKKDEA